MNVCISGRGGSSFQRDKSCKEVGMAFACIRTKCIICYIPVCLLTHHIKYCRLPIIYTQNTKNQTG